MNNTSGRRRRRDSRTAKALNMDAAAVCMDVQALLEELAGVLRTQAAVLQASDQQMSSRAAAA